VEVSLKQEKYLKSHSNAPFQLVSRFISTAQLIVCVYAKNVNISNFVYLSMQYKLQM